MFFLTTELNAAGMGSSCVRRLRRLRNSGKKGPYCHQEVSLAPIEEFFTAIIGELGRKGAFSHPGNKIGPKSSAIWRAKGRADSIAP